MTANWKRNGFWTVAILAVGGALAWILLVSKPGPSPVPLPTLGPPLVDVVVVEPRRRALQVTTQGTVRPLREINLVSQVAGRIEVVSPRFAEGGFFQAGEELIRIESIDYELAIARSESDVAAARQRVAEEQGRSRQAQREWRDLGSEEANALFLRKPQLAAARAALVAAEANLESARLDLARTSLAMPFNGRISDKEVDLGQYVAPGSVVARVYDTDIAQVRLPLTDKQVALLDLPLSYDDSREPGENGAVVDLSARFAGRDWHWQGRIVRTDASIDINSRVVYAVAEIPRPFAREPGSERPPLSPGLFVSATISGRDLEAVSVLPRSALRSDGSVMVVDDANTTLARSVQILQSNPGQIWVQGLSEGERVIVREPTRTLAGTEVQTREVGQLADGQP